MLSGGSEGHKTRKVSSAFLSAMAKEKMTEIYLPFSSDKGFISYSTNSPITGHIL